MAQVYPRPWAIRVSPPHFCAVTLQSEVLDFAVNLDDRRCPTPPRSSSTRLREFVLGAAATTPRLRLRPLPTDPVKPSSR